MLLILFWASGPGHAQSPVDPYSYSRVTSYTYRTDGLLQTETVEPASAPSCVQTTYGYDAFGNRYSATVANCAAAAGRATFASRVSTKSFATQTVTVAGASVAVPAGTFAISDTNALTQTTSRTFDPRFGAVTTSADPNGVIEQSEFDDFGRRTRDIRADGTRTVYYHCFVSGRVTDAGANTPGCPAPTASEIPADAVRFVHSESRDSTGTTGVKNGPFTRSYFDRAGRTIRVVTEAFDAATQVGGASRLIVKDTDFNAQGLPIVTTQPYFLDSGSSLAGGTSAYGMTLTQYDALGRTTTLYTADAQGSQAAVSFNGRGYRPAARTTTVYTGLSSVVTDDKGQTRQEEKNVDGLVVRITDALGAQLVHQHDAFGNLVRTRDALQNVIAIGYDIRGRKLSLTDPDAGAIAYCYDALGQLKAQQNSSMRGSNAIGACPDVADPNNTASAVANWTTLAYDRLGRLRQRVEPEYTSTWTYDAYADASACTKGIGRLCEVATSNGINRRFVFDSIGRQINTRTTISNGPSFAAAVAYDAVNGRLDSRTYPTGVQVKFNYTAKGYVASLSLVQGATIYPLPSTPGGTPGSTATLSANSTLWLARSQSAWGSLEEQSYGNGGVVATSTFDALSGRAAKVAAGSGTSTALVNHAYGWDSVGHMTSRIDANGDGATGAVSETFLHDAVGRLASYTVAGPAIQGFARTVTLDYNALGSILNKSDVGNYSYSAQGAASVRPHAMQSVAGATTTTYSYDLNGNLTSATAGKYRTIAYTSFNLPDSQAGAAGPAGTPDYLWHYDEVHQRLKETRVITGGTMAGTRTTWMLHPENAGGLGFESEVNSPTTASAANPAVTSNRHYLYVGAQNVGVLVSTGALPTLSATQTAPDVLASATLVKVEYWHKDHLGSLVATSDHAAVATARYAYDPFGKRRATGGAYDAAGNFVYDYSPAVNAGTDRGFTGHEQLDDLGLVHMNGRIYDPAAGRFLQADPQLTFPTDLRNYDRYSYVLNDPLGTVDPTGLDPETCIDFACREIERQTARGFIIVPSPGGASQAASAGIQVGAGSTSQAAPGAVSAPVDYLTAAKGTEPAGSGLTLSGAAHGLLGAGSFAPSLIGAAASGLDGLLHLAEGNKTEAGIAIAAAGIGLVSDAGAARVGLKVGAEIASAAKAVREIAWSSKEVGNAAKALERGATEVRVGSRAQAEELFLRRYQGDGYRNVTGMSPRESKEMFGGKAGSYHWDTGAKSYPHGADHLQIHTHEGSVIRIYFP